MATLTATSHETGVGRKEGEGAARWGGDTLGQFLGPVTCVTLLTCRRTAESLNGGSDLALSHLSDHGFVF